MRCIVCGKKVLGEEDVCRECDTLLDMIMDKKSRSKDHALKTFREYAKKGGNYGREK